MFNFGANTALILLDMTDIQIIYKLENHNFPFTSSKLRSRETKCLSQSSPFKVDAMICEKNKLFKYVFIFNIIS